MVDRLQTIAIILLQTSLFFILAELKALNKRYVVYEAIEERLSKIDKVFDDLLKQ